MTIDEQKDFLQQYDNKSLVDKPCLGFSWGVSNFLTDIYIDNKPIVYEIDIETQKVDSKSYYRNVIFFGQKIGDDSKEIRFEVNF